MENWEAFIKKIMELSGFNDWGVEIDEAHKHGKIFIRDHETLVKENLPSLVKHVNHVVQLIAKKHNQAPIFFDINNYRREREELIAELARAAARKVMATGEAISLPAMNAYERRLVHVELATHPEVVTESTGVGHGRYVVVKRIIEEQSRAEARERAAPKEEKTASSQGGAGLL